MRWGDHQGFEWWEGRELGVLWLRMPGRRSSDPASQSSRAFGEGHEGGGGTKKFFMVGDSSSQSLWSHLRRGGVRSWDGDASCMVMETWFEPVEGREVSHPLTKGRSRGLAKARSIMEDRAFPERGNLVYMPGEFSSAKPPSAANSKYGAEEETSWDQKERSGSARGLWMFRSATTRRGTPMSGMGDSGGTEWTLQ